MKTLIVILTFTYTLFANPTCSLSNDIQKQLCKQLAYDANRCENGSTLEYNKHFMMQNGKLLLFIYLNEHDTFRVGNPQTTTPIIVDRDGAISLTEGKNSIDETITSIHQDPNKNIWIVSHWQIEGVYPTLYHSQDGIRWEQTILPKKREIDNAFEWVKKPCFQKKEMILTFSNMDKDIKKSWRSSYQNILHNNPQWKSTSNNPTNCQKEQKNESWEIKKDRDSITFTNKKSKAQITLAYSNPSFKSQTYYIQLGAFKSQKSLDIVKKRVPKQDYMLFSKKVEVNGTPYLKLLIGSFTSKYKAEFILKKLRKSYPSNVLFKEAFVNRLNPI